MTRQTTPVGSEVDSDAESDSSSLVYGHEPFEAFRIRVLELARCLWNECSAENTEVERMKGGSYNRVIGISSKPTERGNGFRYVLRIPRDEDTRLERDVAALQFVQQLGGIPVPDVVTYDATLGSKLGRPYMVQTRLPGTILHYAFPDLNHSDKCRVANELGHVFRRMLDTESEVAGFITSSSGTSMSGIEPGQIAVEPFFQSEGWASSGSGTTTTTTTTTHGLLKALFETRKFESRKRCPKDHLGQETLDWFLTMAAEMDADGWFENTQFSLCHMDFAPRNILVDPTIQSPQSIVTGVLDWDSAALAPSFVSCAPPLWIWGWLHNEDEDERTANDTPATDENKELKRIFEEAAGPLYMRYAYPPAYRLARRLMRFAIHDIWSNEDFYEAQAMLKEWSEIRASLKEAAQNSTPALSAATEHSDDDGTLLLNRALSTVTIHCQQ